MSTAEVCEHEWAIHYVGWPDGVKCKMSICPKCLGITFDFTDHEGAPCRPSREDFGDCVLLDQNTQEIDDGPTASSVATAGEGLGDPGT